MGMIRLPGGASGAILRIVIGALVGGSGGLAFGWWFYLGAQRELGSEFSLFALILWFTVPVGICLGGFAGILVAALSANGAGLEGSGKIGSINASTPPYVDDFELD